MSEKIKPSNLILSLMGSEPSGVLHALSKLCKTCHCLIRETQASSMGETLAIVMQIQGSWNAVAKLETQLPLLEKKWGCQIQHRRLENAFMPLPGLAYTAQIIALDRIGILSEFTKFFQQRKIPLQQVLAQSYQTNRTSTALCNISATAILPQSMNIPALREQFMLYCEELNLDGILEPQKLA